MNATVGMSTLQFVWANKHIFNETDTPLLYTL